LVKHARKVFGQELNIVATPFCCVCGLLCFLSFFGGWFVLASVSLSDLE